MGHWIDVDTLHGPVRAWRAEPVGPSRGAVIVIQEIFGLDAHVRSVADRIAAAGFVAVAPAPFDVVERGIEFSYAQDSYPRARAIATELGFVRAMDVMSATADLLQFEGLRVGAVGFCWGGTLAFLCNTRLGLPAVDYYGARSVPFLDEPMRAPLLCHFGERDASIPADAIELHRQKQPQAQVFVYPSAGHAFNRDADIHAYDAPSAALAWRRTLDFLAENLR